FLQKIAGQTDATTQHVRALFEDAGVETVRFDNRIYRENGLTQVDIRQSPAMRRILEAGYRKTLGDMKNLTLTTANTSQTAYINACNQAYMQITSGAFSYQEAIRQAVQRTSQDGVKVLYPSGYTERIDVAVRRAVLTGVGQTCREIGLMNAQECGCDLMEISAHSGARPSHAQWQGKIVSLSGRRGYLSKSNIGYGTGDGFGGWNCRHDWFPFFEGYSKRNYSAKDLEKLDERNIEYNGKLYNQYEISQIQRRYEREIRSAKREQVAFKVAVEEADNPELRQVMQDSLNCANSLVNDKQAKMRDFIKQTGQNKDYLREQIQNFNHSVKLNTSLKPDNKKIKDNIRHTEYRWNSETNLEKAKRNVKNHSLVERIQRVKEKIRNNGLQERYIHEAGKAMFEEMMVIYDKSNKNKKLYYQLNEQLNEELSRGIVNMEIFKKLETMTVVENHALELKKMLSKVRNVGYNQSAINNHLIGMNDTSFEIVSQAYQYLSRINISEPTRRS
ncbi:MAG: phage minor capsid protein, partial [Ruminococcus sp.]|nr:phage minor capsid protein [Ruminococcus sp.]